jgi:hypothetical protein
MSLNIFPVYNNKYIDINPIFTNRVFSNVQFSSFSDFHEFLKQKLNKEPRDDLFKKICKLLIEESDQYSNCKCKLAEDLGYKYIDLIIEVDKYTIPVLTKFKETRTCKVTFKRDCSVFISAISQYSNLSLALIMASSNSLCSELTYSNNSFLGYNFFLDHPLDWKRIKLEIVGSFYNVHYFKEVTLPKETVFPKETTTLLNWKQIEDNSPKEVILPKETTSLLNLKQVKETLKETKLVTQETLFPKELPDYLLSMDSILYILLNDLKRLQCKNASKISFSCINYVDYVVKRLQSSTLEKAEQNASISFLNDVLSCHSPTTERLINKDLIVSTLNNLKALEKRNKGQILSKLNLNNEKFLEKIKVLYGM